MAPPQRNKRNTAGVATSNYRPFVEKGRWAATGTLPLPEPSTVPEILTQVVLYLCRKVLFVDPKIRLMAYGVMLFLISLMADYAPFPRTYFSAKDNFLNVYFVKFSWGWTFLLSGAFMYLTSTTYCCANKDRTTRHMIRLGIATVAWYCWTKTFEVIEGYTGQCVTKDGSMLHSIKNRRTCSGKSGMWTSLDISGHSFLLIWCVLFMMEEAKAIIGWDGIKDMIRNEEYNRNRGSKQDAGEGLPETNLNVLTEEEFVELKVRYATYDIPAKIVLMGMTCLCLIWDLMVLMTAVYYHVMIEKVLGGLVAAFTWYAVYRGLYKTFDYFALPGQGLFKYSSEPRSTRSGSQQTTSSFAKSKPVSGSGARQRAREPADDTPKFMGMPLHALKNARKEEASQEQLD